MGLRISIYIVLLALISCNGSDDGIKPQSILIGFHISETMDASSYTARVGMMDSIGGQVVRVPVDWAALEPDSGIFDTAYLGEINARLSSIEGMGMKAIVMFTQSPEWANGGNPPYYPPDSLHYSAYAQALSRFFSRLCCRSSIMGVEIWNEPNSIDFWPTYSTPRQGTYVLVPLEAALEYGSLLKVAYGHLKSMDSSITVAGGSLASADTAYLQVLIDSFGNTIPMDVLSVHPYARPDEHQGPHYGYAQYPDQCNSDDPLSPPWCFEEGLESIRRVLDMYGETRGMPIWITEFGVSSGYGWGDAGGEEEQRLHYLIALDIIERRHYRHDLNIPVMTFYRLMDEPDDSFGVYRMDGSLKPAGEYFMEFMEGVR